MALKDYVNIDTLKQFLDNLYATFAPISHEHVKSEIVDLQDLTATDDGNGNVTLTCSSADSLIIYDNDRLNELETEVIALKDELNNNSYLIVNDSSN